MHRGIVLLYGNIYFLEYDQVEGVLLAMADLRGKKAPNRHEWERQRHARFRKMLEVYETDVRQAVKTVEGATGRIYDVLRRTLQSASYAAELVHLAKYTGRFTPIALIGGLGGLGAVIGYDVAENDSRIIKTMGRLLARPFDVETLERYTPEEAERIGRIFGHLLGAFALNGAIFKKGTRLGRLAGKDKVKGEKPSRGQKAVAKFVTEEFGHGYFMPVVKAVLFHYIVLLERLKTTAQGLWDRIESEMQDILLADHPELEPFRTEDEDQITFPRVQRMVLRLDEILSEHLKELAADPELPDKIKAMADHLQSARIPSFYDLLDGKHLPEWSREAMSFVMLSHLHTALLAFGEMLALVVTALDPKSPRPVRLLDLFAIMGIQTGENAASDILAKDLRSVFEVASTQGTAP